MWAEVCFDERYRCVCKGRLTAHMFKNTAYFFPFMRGDILWADVPIFHHKQHACVPSQVY